MVNIPMMDSYLESVAGYVCDEDKLVTYKWLSKELEVHVNVAKIILARYWEKYSGDKLVATFMLIGNLKSGGTRVEVVKNEDLSKAKEKFEKIIAEHIYSVQKTLTNIELLALTDKGDSRYSAIRCNQSVLLSDEELLKLRWGKSCISESASIQSTDEKKSTRNINVVKENTGRNDYTPKSVDETSNENETRNEEKPTKKISPSTKHRANEKKTSISKKQPVQSTKTGYGNLFGKAVNRQKTGANSIDVSSKKSESCDAPREKSSEVRVDDSFERAKVDEREASSDSSRNEKATKENTKKLNLQDQNEKTSENKKSSDVASRMDEKSVENENSSDLSKNASASSSLDKRLSSKNENKLKKNDKSTNNEKRGVNKNEKISRGKKRERSHDSQKETKKRKRIFVESDSSEDSAVASDEEVILESPQRQQSSKVEEKSSSPQTIQSIGNKRKVRKLTDKTFVDEDGFLITKKIEVYESCSEEEPEKTETKKKIEPEETKETKPNVKKKQPTLMHFFKKA